MKKTTSTRKMVAHFSCCRHFLLSAIQDKITNDEGDASLPLTFKLNVRDANSIQMRRFKIDSRRWKLIRLRFIL